jgi:hypothetical protein
MWIFWVSLLVLALLTFMVICKERTQTDEFEDWARRRNGFSLSRNSAQIPSASGTVNVFREFGDESTPPETTLTVDFARASTPFLVSIKDFRKGTIYGVAKDPSVSAMLSNWNAGTLTVRSATISSQSPALQRSTIVLKVGRYLGATDLDLGIRLLERVIELSSLPAEALPKTRDLP